MLPPKCIDDIYIAMWRSNYLYATAGMQVNV